MAHIVDPDAPEPSGRAGEAVDSAGSVESYPLLLTQHKSAAKEWTTSILDLANEILDLIIDQIENDPFKGVNVDRRAYLSKESFTSPREPSSTSSNSAKDLGNWRKTCRRFSELGAAHQFARVSTRFEHHDFERLEWLAGQRNLVEHVKQFSYMVPWFYVKGRDRLTDILPDAPDGLDVLDLHEFSGRMSEQGRIVESEEDQRALKKALSAFTKLQHIKILPVQDALARSLISLTRQYRPLARYLDVRWPPACSHSTKTVGEALLASHSPFKRFSSQLLSPQSAIGLAEHSPGLVTGISDTLHQLASKLTCLEIHFDDLDGVDLDSKMRDLSPVFKIVFTAARNLEAVHMGFPSHRPLSLKLEDLFHNVRWEGLLAFGIQGWKLDANEIMALAGRHRDKLRGLRLRDVLLNEGSMWKDVLDFLRNNVRSLDWVSLRRIGYTVAFDEQATTAGVEVLDDPPGGYSSSSDSDFESDEELDQPPADVVAEEDDAQDVGPSNSYHSSYDDQDSDPHPDHHSVFSASTDQDDSEDERGMAGDQMYLPQFIPDTPSSVPWCSCGENRTDPGTADELGDNGSFLEIDPRMRRLWERWVVRRCPEHSSR